MTGTIHALPRPIVSSVPGLTNRQFLVEGCSGDEGGTRLRYSVWSFGGRTRPEKAFDILAQDKSGDCMPI